MCSHVYLCEKRLGTRLCAYTINLSRVHGLNFTIIAILGLPTTQGRGNTSKTSCMYLYANINHYLHGEIKTWLLQYYGFQHDIVDVIIEAL